MKSVMNSDYYYGDDENTQYYTHSIMGSVEKKDFVCEGYAKAAQLYLNYIGVDTILLSGYAEWRRTCVECSKVRQW